MRKLLFALFCLLYASVLAKTCPNCNCKVLDSDAFCPNCGRGLAESPKPVPAAPKANPSAQSESRSVQEPKAAETPYGSRSDRSVGSSSIIPLKLSILDPLALPVEKDCTVCGLHISAIYGDCGVLYGIQIAGLGEKCRKMYGAAVAGIVNDATDAYGIQIGLFNVAEHMRGIQIGFANYSKRMSGVQIGVLNTIDRSSVQFMPVLNMHF